MNFRQKYALNMYKQAANLSQLISQQAAQLRYSIPSSEWDEHPEFDRIHRIYARCFTREMRRLRKYQIEFFL